MSFPQFRIVRPAQSAIDRAPTAQPDSRLKMELTATGSCLPVVESLATIRARKDDATRATLRPEIAAMPIAVSNPDLAAILSKIVDAYEASPSVPAYSPLNLFDAALEKLGLVEPVWGANFRIGYKPAASVLNAKAPVSAKKADHDAAFRPGSLLGLRNP